MRIGLTCPLIIQYFLIGKLKILTMSALQLLSSLKFNSMPFTKLFFSLLYVDHVQLILSKSFERIIPLSSLISVFLNFSI